MIPKKHIQLKFFIFLSVLVHEYHLWLLSWVEGEGGEGYMKSGGTRYSGHIQAQGFFRHILYLLICTIAHAHMHIENLIRIGRKGRANREQR